MESRQRGMRQVLMTGIAVGAVAALGGVAVLTQAGQPKPAPQPKTVRELATAPQPNKHVFAMKGKGETFTVPEEISEVKLTSAMTDGRYSFLDEVWHPGMVVPPHYHKRHSETFYIVSGQVEWTVGGETRLMGAGDLVFIPPDTIHSVKVVGNKDMQSLMIYDPGGYEYHARREAQYTPAQQKQPEIQKMLREMNDFNPVP